MYAKEEVGLIQHDVTVCVGYFGTLMQALLLPWNGLTNVTLVLDIGLMRRDKNPGGCLATNLPLCPIRRAGLAADT